MCLSREIRRKWGDGLLLSPIQILFTGTDQEQQVKKTKTQTHFCLSSATVFIEIISLMSPVGGDSTTTDKSRWILAVLTLCSLFFHPSICVSAPCSIPSLPTHTTTTPSSPSSLFFPGPQCHAPGSRPASPQPIRLTRPVLRQSSAADIVLEKPVETGWVTKSFTPFLFTLNNFYFSSCADGLS